MKKTILLLIFLSMAASQVLSAPTITHEELVTVANDHAVITWVTSDETSNTEIEYGLLLPSTITTPETSLVTNHNCRLSSLYPSTTYVYRVRCTNAAGITTYGDYKTFTTLTPPTGDYLFSFATITDSQAANGTLPGDTTGARGRKYTDSDKLLQAAVDLINDDPNNPAFTIVKGDLVDHRTDLNGGTSAADMAAIVKTKLASLDATYATIYPIPGNHDKDPTTYGAGENWYTKSLGLIRANIAAAADPTRAAVYNYSFNSNNYHFICLDSQSMTTVGTVDVTWLAADLAANTDKKSFIFLHNCVTDEANPIPIEVVEEVAGSADWNKIDLSNRSDFLALLVTYKDNIVGIFSGHIHDNYRYYRNNESVYGHAPLDFPFVRTASVIQFPVGVNIYKVYSNGYMQLFYKASSTWSETARGQITAEAGYSTTYWTNEMMGTAYDRCFVHTYSSIATAPTVQTYTPTNGKTGVPLNQEVILKFSKAMDTSIDVSTWFTSAPSMTFSFSWSSDSRTLTARPASAFTANTAYTISLSGAAKAADGTYLTAVNFSFTTGSSSTSTAPEISITEIANDVTADNTPSFTGIATDSVSTVTSVQYRVDGGDWSNTTPLNGTFDSSIESFEFTISDELTRQRHTLELRATNSAGITSSSYLTYRFYVAGSLPEIYLTTAGTSIINGDPIEASPSLEVTVICTSGLDKLYYSVDNSARTDITPAAKAYINELFYHPTLTGGTHKILFEAIDNDGDVSTQEANNLIVQTSGDPIIIGTPLPFPNPFNPDTGTALISYVLSKSSDVVISVHDLAGNVVSKTDFALGSAGGTAGYNEASWDGKDGGGNTVGNGIYIFLVIADGKVIGRGKVTVIK